MKKMGAKNIIWFEYFFIIANLLIIILFYKDIPLATILLALTTILGMIKWKSIRTLYIFILIGIGATILEIIAVYIGIWKYTITNFLGVPFWLFIAWGNAGAVIYQISKNLKERRLNLKDTDVEED